MNDKLKKSKKIDKLGIDFSKLKLSSDSTSVLWSKNLELSYVNIDKKINQKIPDKETHNQLISTGNTFKDLIKTKLPKSKVGSDGDPQTNILIVNIGFLLSKPDKRGNNFISIPLKIYGKDYFSAKDAWFVDDDSEEVKERYQHRHDKGKENTPQTKGFDEVQSKGPEKYDDNYFYQKFHHSEQAIFEYLVRRGSIEELVKRLVQYSLEESTEILSVLLDMHSTRYVCGNCELGMQGMMHPEELFLKNLAEELKKHKLQYDPKKGGLIPRISANKPEGTKAKKNEKQHTANDLSKTLGERPEKIRNKSIYQVDTDTYKADKVETDFHRRTAGLSGDVSQQASHYNSAINTLLTNEYARMIQTGKNLYQHTKLNMTEKNIDEETQEILEYTDEEKQAFLELATLDAKIDFEQSINQATEVMDARKEYEQKIIDGNDYFSALNDVGVPMKKLSQLTKRQLEILNDNDIPEVIEAGRLKFDEILLLTDQEFEDLLANDDVICVIDAGVPLKKIMKFYRKSPDIFDDLMQYKIADIMNDHKLSFDTVVELYNENYMHLECLENHENLYEVVQQEAPEVNPILMSYLDKYEDVSEIINMVREDLCPSDQIDFDRNLDEYYGYDTNSDSECTDIESDEITTSSEESNSKDSDDEESEYEQDELPIKQKLLSKTGFLKEKSSVEYSVDDNERTLIRR